MNLGAMETVCHSGVFKTSKSVDGTHLAILLPHMCQGPEKQAAS